MVLFGYFLTRPCEARNCSDPSLDVEFNLHLHYRQRGLFRSDLYINYNDSIRNISIYIPSVVVLEVMAMLARVACCAVARPKLFEGVVSVDNPS